MTEAELKDQICPVMTSAASNAVCIGSKCAMWRWDSNGLVWGGRKEPEAQDVAKRHGHCGMAGRYDS